MVTSIMPLQPYMDYVSVDDHLLEPPDLWTSRLPAHLREDGPQLHFKIIGSWNEPSLSIQAAGLLPGVGQ